MKEYEKFAQDFVKTLALSNNPGVTTECMTSHKTGFVKARTIAVALAKQHVGGIAGAVLAKTISEIGEKEV